MQGPNGKKWLNLNLGAEYAKESSPHFNPEALPTDYNDWKAFGNLYQWGRGSDRHEQVEYRQGSERWEFRPINGVRSTILEIGESSSQMVADPNSNVYAKGLGESWANNPCPNGYHIATVEDIKGLGKLDMINGGLDTPSLFGNSLYPSLLLMTSPTLELTSLMNEGWNVSTAGVKSSEGGTSQMWVLGSGEDLVTDGSAWEKDPNPTLNSVQPLLDVIPHPICTLDRGFYTTHLQTYEQIRSYEYGISCLFKIEWSTVPRFKLGLEPVPSPAKAIRCVQN